MSLPEKYDRKLREALGGRAVWKPGTATALGDVMIEDGDGFEQAGSLADFGFTFNVKESLDQSLDLRSTGTSQRVFQAGVEVKPQAIDFNAEASIKLEFNKAFEFMLKTPTLKSHHITNLLTIAGAIAKHASWQHKRFYIVHELFTAEEFAFLGTEKSSSSIEFSGKGSDVNSFLTAGVSAGLKKSGNVGVDIIGKGGPVAMGLVRVKKDGRLDFD